MVAKLIKQQNIKARGQGLNPVFRIFSLVTELFIRRKGIYVKYCLVVENNIYLYDLF